MATDARGMTVPAGGGAPKRADVNALALSINHVHEIADVAGRATLISALTAAGLTVSGMPIVARRADAAAGEELEYTVDAGTTWHRLAVGVDASTFTPSLTNFTLGNGTIDGWRSESNGVVTLHIYITFGSTTGISGTLTLNLDDDAISSGLPVGSAYLQDTSAGGAAGRHIGTVQTTNAGTQAFIIAEDGNYVSTNVPFTWLTGDRLVLSATYIKA